MNERQRLGVQDALWLEMDKPGNLMVVDSLFWTATPIDWDRYAAVMKERLWDRFPVFRSVVVRGADNQWFWEEQPAADLEARFERVTLPDPGGDVELQELIAEQRVVRLDRSEPLWRAILVDNYRGGSAVLFRAHHAIADGIRMVQLALSVFDATPDGVQVAADAVQQHVPTPRAPAVVGAGDGAPHEPAGSRSRAADLTRTSVQLARSAVTNPVGAAHTALTLSETVLGAVGAEARSAVRRAVGAGGFLTPVVSAVPGDVDAVRKLVLGTRNDNAMWTGPVGEHKAVAWSPPLSLDEVKDVAHASGATVNDVLVTCVAESLHAYLEKHQAVCHSVTWDVPVNLKPFDPTLPVTLGNSFALVELELPTNLDDPLETLEVVRHRMERIKDGHEAVLDFGVQAVIARANKWLYRAVVDLVANRAIGVLTNVPGPKLPLYAAGQRVEGMLGWAPVTANQVMSFTIYSYAGQVFVGIAADADRVPDHGQVVDGFAEAFRRLSVRLS